MYRLHVRLAYPDDAPVSVLGMSVLWLVGVCTENDVKCNIIFKPSVKFFLNIDLLR